MQAKYMGRLLVLVLVLTVSAPLVQAGPINSFYSLKASPATTLSGTGNTDNPSLGTLATTGSGARLMGYFPEQTLMNIDDKIELSFTVSFADNTSAMGNGTDNFRYALFDINGEDQESTNLNFATVGTANTDALRGYWYGIDTNSSTSGAQGSIRERSGTTADQDPFANASAPLIGAPSGLVSFALGETYTGTMTLTLTDTNEITLSGSFVDSGGGSNTFSFVDTTPVTKKFSVVGFLNGGALSADQANFQNVSVTYTPSVPEPASCALGMVALAIAASARRRV